METKMMELLNKLGRSIYDVRESMVKNNLITQRNIDKLTDSEILKIVNSKKFWKTLTLRNLI